MGSGASSPVLLAPAFQRMSTWELKNAKRLLQDYKDKDLDFGLDAQALSELLAGDKDWAAEIIGAFSSTNGIVNALAFICGVCMACPGSALEKAGLVFDALDFDATEQISMDEMTIVFLCATRGFCVVSGVGAVPSDEDLESVTLSAYRELNKSSGQSISKVEFTKWVLRFAAGDSTAASGKERASEVTIESAMEQFGVTSTQKVGSTGDKEVANPANGEENNPPDQQPMEYHEVEVEAEASTFDAAYQAQEDIQAPGNEEGDGALGELSALAVEPEASPEEGASQPAYQQHIEEASCEEDANEYAEAPDQEASREPLEAVYPAPMQEEVEEQEGQAIVAQSDEAQEDYEQGFAVETPRDAAVAVVAEEQKASEPARDLAQREEDVAQVQAHEEEDASAGEVNSSTENLEAELERDEIPAPLDDELQPIASSKPQSGSDIIEKQADPSPSTETAESLEEPLPAQDAEQEETIAPVPSARLEEEKAEGEKKSSEQAPPVSEVPELEFDANYEDDGCDLPSARSDEAATAGAAPVGSSVEIEEDAPPPLPSEENVTGDAAAEKDATADSGGVDLNDFGAYDYTQSEYDASSGLPPPEDPVDYAVEDGDKPDTVVDDGAAGRAANPSPTPLVLPTEEANAAPGGNSEVPGDGVADAVAVHEGN